MTVEELEKRAWEIRSREVYTVEGVEAKLDSFIELVVGFLIEAVAEIKQAFDSRQ